MGSSSASKEAKRARKAEEERQARIRQGTQRINDIFAGQSRGVGAVDLGSSFDPYATYYTADGQMWRPDENLMRDVAAVQPRYRETNDGLRVLAQAGSPGRAGISAEQQYQNMLRNQGLYRGVETKGGFNDDFFTGRRQAYLDYATPQIDDQYADAQKQLAFALARSGTLDSSVRGQKTAELQKQYDLTTQQVADQALSYETEARNAVEDARANLISMLNATGDAEGAANAALARSQALSQPVAFSPLTNLFADFTSTLGRQAAFERANHYSGGQTGARYDTGLFTPSSSAVVNKR